MDRRGWLGVFWVVALATPAISLAQTPPPAPVLVAPGNGASLVQPITIQWQAVSDPDGPIGSYTWQVSTSSAFGSVIASGFSNADGDVPTPTTGRVSGLANGTYFWRVKAAQNVGGATGFIDSPWSALRSFTITGLGPAPGTPTINAPAFNASFHPVEFFDIEWSEVPGAQYYLLEADDDSGFSHPITLGSTVVFGTRFHAGWGNEIPNVFYRVRAVSSDNVRGLPSSTLTVHVTNAAPVPAPPTPLSPVGGATITLPFTFDWTDTPNPQINGYDIDIDDEPNFQGAIGVLLVTNISRSDYMVVPDPLKEGINRLPPGQYFWRVRAIHGNAFGPWSAGQSFRIAASPPTPAGLELFWIIADPGSVSGGNPTAARIALNMPAPSGGTLVRIASDFPGVETPTSVLIPAGSTDAVVSPVTTSPVSGASIGTLRAAFGMSWEQSSIGSWNILWGGSLSAERIVGGSSLTGTVTLLGPAPPGGVEVRILSNNTALARPPASVLIPEGATEATFNVTTAAVTEATRVVFSFGTPFEGYQSPETWLVLLPAGSPAPPPALSTLTLSPTTLLGGNSGTGTVTLTAAAPAGGARIRLSGSMEGDVVVPAEVVVPAGGTSADFPITPPKVARSHWVLIQASYGFTGMLHASTLRVDPGGPGPSKMFAIDVRPNAVVGGGTVRGTVGLSVPAPPGGATVSLASSDPSVAQVPASVSVAAGNSTASFAVTTSAVPSAVSASVTGTAGGESRTAFFQVTADPNAPLSLLSITPSVSGATGGNPINTTLFLNKSAPAGGAVVTLSSSNTAAARVPATVTVPAGLGFASFDITTSPVAVDTPVTITGTLNATRTATITVMAPPSSLASIALSPTSVIGGSPVTGTATLSSAAPSGGAVVSLSSSNTAVATVPASVTVAAGATSATFPVATTAVTANTSVTVTGSAGGTTRTATLSVTTNVPPSGFRGPTANGADSGGDGNGFENGAANANGDDAANATDSNSGTASSLSCTSTARDRHRFFNYGLSVPAGSSVRGIEVRLDARVDATGGSPATCVQLSWNGGASWTAARTTPPLTTSIASYVVGGPADAWGRTWTPAELSNASFRVRLINVANSTTRDFSLDWVAVRVTTGAAAPDSTPPTVSVTAPSSGATLSGAVTISAAASDDGGISRVEFLVDGALLASDTTSPYSASWSTTATSNGTHSLSARAFDAAGNQATSAAVSVTVNNGTADTTPPTVSVTAPSAGATVSGNVTISAAASDNVGVSRVEFFVDGALLASDTTSPYSASWSTTTASNGTHSLSTRAFDAAGNQATSAAISVTVNNGSPPVLDLTLGGVPTTIRRGQFFTATGSVANTGGSPASGYTVRVSFTPTDSMRLESPQSATQTLPAVSPGATQAVSWSIRADRTSTATLTMTLVAPGGATVDTASRTFSIAD